MRIVFMGTPEFALPSLERLVTAGYQVIAVYTQPDKKTGRKQTIEKSPVRIAAEKNNIPVLAPIRFDSGAILEIEKQKPEIIIAAAYGKILPEKLPPLLRKQSYCQSPRKCLSQG